MFIPGYPLHAHPAEENPAFCANHLVAAVLLGYAEHAVGALLRALGDIV